MPYTTAQISENLGKAYAISERIHQMRLRRINDACRLAGLGSMGCQLHNCLVSLSYGKPWREVNYSYARKANWLCKTQFKSSEIIDLYYKRMIEDMKRAA